MAVPYDLTTRWPTRNSHTTSVDSTERQVEWIAPRLWRGRRVDDARALQKPDGQSRPAGTDDCREGGRPNTNRS